MKLKHISCLTLLLIIFIASSCNYDDLTDLSTKSYSRYRVPIDVAKENVLNFISNFKSTTRTANLSIENVEVFSLTSSTRSSSKILLDSMFYVVNFEGDNGFAIAASDKRDAPVFALVENGRFSYNINGPLNSGFEVFIDCLINKKIYENKLETNYKDCTNMEYEPSEYTRKDRFVVMSPLLNTAWGQSSPYNKFCHKNMTGCVVSAISQICSFLQLPNQLRYNYNGDIGFTLLNWDKINKECKENIFRFGCPDTDESKSQVAHLMRFFGGAFGAQYGQNSTSVNTEDAVEIMRDRLGYNVSGLHNYNVDDVISDLKSGNKIILMRGYARYYHVFFVIRKYVDGHAWVVDGYIDQIRSGKEFKYLHCNWGWNGSHNGYFLSNVLNANEGPVYANEVSTRNSNFRYKLKTATFKK